MPSSSCHPTTTNQHFDLQSKQSSRDLQDKFSSILERFEETRQAIKDNVRMLEKMTESSSATNLGDEETSSSYPYSLNKKGRSISSTRLSSMDTGNTSGSNYGLRTISSVDSGVMLTLTSCSDNGTQSRSRSFGSWTGATSPLFLTHEDHLEDTEPSAGNILPGEETDHSSDGVEVIASSNDSDGAECEGVQRHTSSYTHSAVERDQSRFQKYRKAHLTIDSESEESLPYDKERFETQEHFIVFEENDSDIYHRLSSPSSFTPDSPVGFRGNQSSKSSQSTKSDHSSVGSSYKNGAATKCIVLPAIQRVKEQGLRRPTSLNVQSHLHFQDKWVERDHFSVSNQLSPKINQTNNNFSSNEISYQLTDKGFQNFSPIPEESPSELTPSPQTRHSRSDKAYYRLVIPPNRVVTSSDTDYSVVRKEMPSHADSEHYQFESTAAENMQLYSHQMYGKDPNHLHPALPNKKYKKFRYKRKKLGSPPKASQSHDRYSLASSTSSSTSVPGVVGTPKSDRMSMNSYQHAVQMNNITLPQVSDMIDSRAVDSSSSSPSYYDLVYSTSSASSLSSCSDSEYDQEVLMQAKRRPNHVTQSQIPTISQQLAMLKQSKHKPPVMRKMSKEGSLGKQPNNSQRGRLFKKNSPSNVPASKQKLLKSKSDEASHSLLRYFRFPSPPRTTEDNSDSSHMDRKTRPRMQHQMSQTSSGGDCKKKDGGREGRSAYADRGRRRRNGNSSCSCMTSSTSDTASEIAYPDLRPRRLKAALSTSQQNIPENTQPINHQNTKLNSSGISSHKVIADAASSPAVIQNSSSQIEMLPAAFSSLVARDPDHPVGYALHSPSKQKISSKSKSFSLFSCLFKKSKQKKEEKPTDKQLQDPKLMLDLLEGEVRVKPQDPVLYSIPEDNRYGDIMRRNLTTEMPHYSDYSPIEHHVFEEASGEYARSVTSHPAARHAPSPVYLLPVRSSEKTTSAKIERPQYLVQEFPSDRRYITHRPQYQLSQSDAQSSHSPLYVYSNDIGRLNRKQPIQHPAPVTMHPHITANRLTYQKTSTPKVQQMVYPVYGQKGVRRRPLYHIL